MSGGLSGLAPSRGASAAKSPGSLPPPAPLSCATSPQPAGGGHARRSLASVGRKGRGKSVLSRFQCGVSEKRSTTTARASPSEREALWSLNSCPARVSGPTFVRRTPLRRHLLDPARRKSSIHPASNHQLVTIAHASDKIPDTTEIPRGYRSPDKMQHIATAGVVFAQSRIKISGWPTTSEGCAL